MELHIAARDQREFVNALRMIGRHSEIPVIIHPVSIQDCEEITLGRIQGFDIVLASSDWFQSAKAFNAIVNLTESLCLSDSDDWKTDYHPALLSMTTIDSQTYGIPFHDGPQVLHYRKDIFEDEDLQSLYFSTSGRHLRPPLTWSDFKDIAAFLTNHRKGLWGCCFAGYPDGHNNVYDFLLQLWSRGGDLYDAQGSLLLNTDIAVESLQYLSNLIHVDKSAPPDSLKIDSVQSGNFYARGNVAMMWNWSGYCSVFEDSNRSNIVGLNKTTTLPYDVRTGVPISLNSYWALCVLKTSTNQKLALQYIRYATTSQADLNSTFLGICGVRRSTWTNHDVLKQWPVFSLMEETHNYSKTIPIHKDWPQICRIISCAVDDALNLRMSTRKALERAQLDLDKLAK